MRSLVRFSTLLFAASLLSGCIVEPVDGYRYGDHARYDRDGRDHREGAYEHREDRRDRW
jgi:hypothetical protein